MRSFVVCVHLILIFSVFSRGEEYQFSSAIKDALEMDMTPKGPEIENKSGEDSNAENNSNDSRVRAAIKEENENFRKVMKEIWKETAEYTKTLESLPNFSRLSEESKGLGEETVEVWRKITQKCFCEKGLPGHMGKYGPKGSRGLPGVLGAKGDPGTIERSENLC